MIALSQQEHDSSESQALEQINISSSASSMRLVTNTMPTEKMPSAQILSYLVPYVSDSGSAKDSDLYEMLVTHIANTDSSVKDSLPREVESRNIVFHEKFKAKPRHEFFTSLQAWEGIVMEVMADAFLARLIDLTNTGVDEEAEFPIEEISDEDIPLIKSGSIFYWDIGYHTNYSGQRTRISLVRFRRLPARTQREIDAAKREAYRIRKALGWQ
jgi:hypothetical protein